MVSHIDVKSNFNRETNQAIAEKSNIDNLRTKNNPKLTYGGKVLSGKGTIGRGKIGEVYQHRPKTFYANKR